MATLDDLVREFSADGTRWERGPGDLPFLVIETSRCTARMTPYGAQVCEWTPAAQASPVLFLSPRAVFAAGTPIRGGVPLCFPWFGAHATDPARPAHGFARTRMWRMADVIADETGQVHVGLRLSDDAGTRALWDAAFEASLTISFGTTLTMTLAVENVGSREIAYESALHTYLAVGDVAQVRISGLEHTAFLDKVDGGREKRSKAEPVTFAGETDRIYLATTTTCTVDDPVLRRVIRVEKRGSDTTVVWNPGREKALAVRDIGEAWDHFVCVETVNCGPHAVRLPPGERRAMTAHLATEARRL
jgi:glucose-6-phosphate 1-epimerase